MIETREGHIQPPEATNPSIDEVANMLRLSPKEQEYHALQWGQRASRQAILDTLYPGSPTRKAAASFRTIQNRYKSKLGTKLDHNIVLLGSRGASFYEICKIGQEEETIRKYNETHGQKSWVADYLERERISKFRQDAIRGTIELRPDTATVSEDATRLHSIIKKSSVKQSKLLETCENNPYRLYEALTKLHKLHHGNIGSFASKDGFNRIYAWFEPNSSLPVDPEFISYAPPVLTKRIQEDGSVSVKVNPPGIELKPMSPFG